MDKTSDLLDDRSFFLCEHFKTKMLKRRCVERQAHEIPPGPFNAAYSFDRALSFAECRECSQGKKIAVSWVSEEAKPSRGQGERKEDCLYYWACLEVVAKNDWKSFNCLSCANYKQGVKAMTDKEKNTRICETDGCGKTTMSPNCPYCPSCMARRANEKRSAQGAKRETKPRPDKSPVANAKGRAEGRKSIVGQIRKPGSGKVPPTSSLPDLLGTLESILGVLAVQMTLNCLHSLRRATGPDVKTDEALSREMGGESGRQCSHCGGDH